MTTSGLIAEVERRLAQDAGLHLYVHFDDGKVVLTGMVETEAERETALDIVGEVAPQYEVEDDLELTDELPEIEAGPERLERERGNLEEVYDAEDEDGAIEAGDFTDEPTLSSGDLASGPTSAFEEDVVSEGDIVFVPPTDPVVGPNDEVIGGLQLSSLDSIEVERSALDGKPGDEAIHDAIVRELREDAATTDLVIEVEVEEGMATLRGTVPYVEDAENAEEVAARVPGVIEVDEQLEVENL